MSFIGVGSLIEGVGRPATKKALKTALAVDPSKVTFDTTSGFSARETISAYDLVAGVSYSVVGPDPYTSRKWYATVKLNAAGAITVS